MNILEKIMSKNNSKTNNKKLSEKELAKAGIYKGYDVRWLKEVGSEHPDFHLVEKFENKYGEIK